MYSIKNKKLDESSDQISKIMDDFSKDICKAIVEGFAKIKAESLIFYEKWDPEKAKKLAKQFDMVKQGGKWYSIRKI